MQEWAAISQDLAQKLIESIPGRIEEVLNEKGQHCKYWVFAYTMQLSIKAIDIYETIVIILQYIIVTSEKNDIKNTEAADFVKMNICVILKSFGLSCMQSLMLCFQASNVTLN